MNNDNEIVWREYTIGGEEEEKLTNEEKTILHLTNEYLVKEYGEGTYTIKRGNNFRNDTILFIYKDGKKIIDYKAFYYMTFKGLVLGKTYSIDKLLEGVTSYDDERYHLKGDTIVDEKMEKELKELRERYYGKRQSKN